MQKFPLRMKDNDLLVTELYKDPSNDSITAISVYLTPKTTSKYRFSNFGFWHVFWVLFTYFVVITIDMQHEVSH